MRGGEKSDSDDRSTVCFSVFCFLENDITVEIH